MSAEIITDPIKDSSAWLKADLDRDQGWRDNLTRDQVADASQAVEAAMATGKDLQDLSAGDFPFLGLADHFQRWKNAVSDGLGVQLISGVPVDEWGEEKSSIFFWGMGLHMGTPGVQNPEGHVLGHVTDTGRDRSDPLVRLYQTSSHINFHCDGLDIVGLLCLSEAKAGGASRIVSSVAIYNELLRKRPDLVPLLYTPFAMDKRNEPGTDGAQWHLVQPCHVVDGRLRTFYHVDYFNSVTRHNDCPPRSERLSELMIAYEEIAADPRFWFDMEIRKGEIQFVSNRTVLHGRTNYEDDPAAGIKRHLLRLWLTL